MYYKEISGDDKNFQYDNLPDPIDTNDSNLMEFPKIIKLSALCEILSRRNRNIALRYHEPNKEINPEKYAHCLLILFYTFTDEKQLVINEVMFLNLMKKMCWKLLTKINKYLSQIQTLLTSLTRYVKKEIHTKMIITL